jgi:hypothetical protein
VIIEDSLLSIHDVMGLAAPTRIVYEICDCWIIVAGIGITLTRQYEFIKY